MDQPVPTAIVEPSKINWLLFSLIGVAILITGIVAGVFVGKYIYTSKLTPSPIISASPSPTPTNQTCVTPPPECVTESGSIKLECSPPYIGEYCVSPTANWKTYTGKSFSLKYPMDLDVLTENNSKIEFGNSIFKTVILSVNYTNLTSLPKDSENIFIDGRQAKRFQITGIGGYLAIQTFEKPLMEIRYATGLGESKETEKLLFNQILSTFKFTN